MLKIKADVDLKELEKFGFEIHNFIGCWAIKSKNRIEYWIDLDSGIIEIETDDWGGRPYLDDTIYDLIQAGIIEKDEEDNEE